MRSSASRACRSASNSRQKIQADLLDEVFGLGPLEPLLRDPTISDILVNGKDHVFIERGGMLDRRTRRSATTGI